MDKGRDVAVLAIESSCDETAAAVVVNGRQVLSNVVASQIDIHAEYGGVVPEIASRKHVESICLVTEKALRDAGKTIEDIDVIGVTYGPGLVGALLVGVSAAKAMACGAEKPLVGVNHIEGHIAANYIEHHELSPPFLALVVSGGHTNLVEVKDYGEYTVIGRTRDDAAGEAFDKVARALGLGYPGGVKIDSLSAHGNPEAISFPIGRIDEAPFDFSFSGVKSAVLNYMNMCEMKRESYEKADVAASFQKAVVEALVEKTSLAAECCRCDKIVMAGGVAANRLLRNEMEKMCAGRNISCVYPSLAYCTDNAAMIGAAAYYEYLEGVRHGWDLNAVPHLELQNRSPEDRSEVRG